MFFSLRHALLAFLPVLILALSSSLYAQSGGATLQGTVTDPSGAVIPNAHVRIVSMTTGVVHDAVANGNGIYSAPDISAGQYTVSIAAPGFSSKVNNDVLLSVGAVRDLDVVLAISSTDMTITVETSANQVNPADTSIQGVVDAK